MRSGSRRRLFCSSNAAIPRISKLRRREHQQAGAQPKSIEPAVPRVIAITAQALFSDDVLRKPMPSPAGRDTQARATMAARGTVCAMMQTRRIAGTGT